MFYSLLVLTYWITKTKNLFMKKLLKILTLSLSTCMFISCEKSTSIDSTPKSSIVKSKFEQIPQIEESIIMSQHDQLGIKLKAIIKNSNLTIDYNNAVFHKIKFKGFPSLIGIHVQGLEYGLISKSLFYVCDTISKMDLVIEREKNGFTNSNNGYISLRNLNKEMLFNDQIINNRFYNQNSFAKIPVFVNSKNIKSNREWICSEEKFNAFYQEAKANCEEDWLCDVACSINPCFISYLAFAVGKCSQLIK